MEKVYADVPENQRPMMLGNIEVTNENVAMYLGTEDIEFEEALASEPGIGSIAHSVVVIKLKDGEDAASVAAEIKEKINPRKWVCVEAEEVEVESKGNLIILIMSSEKNVEKIETEFDKL